MKYFLLFIIPFLFLGCSSTKLKTTWNNAKHSSYVAVKDPLTWGTAISAGALYATYDDDITNRLMKKNVMDSEDDEILRDINGVMLYSSALLVENDDSTRMIHRLATDLAGSTTARWTTNGLNTTISKETPSGNEDYAIGSHHAVDTFADSALIRKNVKDMSIPKWSKYSINTISYLSASGSALTRVQEGGHSVADQLLNASIGNFIGVFFYEAFMQEDETIEVSAGTNSFSLKTIWSF
jgi:hypothetical protein